MPHLTFPWFCQRGSRTSPHCGTVCASWTELLLVASPPVCGRATLSCYTFPWLPDSIASAWPFSCSISRPFPFDCRQKLNPSPIDEVDLKSVPACFHSPTWSTWKSHFDSPPAMVTNSIPPLKDTQTKHPLIYRARIYSIVLSPNSSIASIGLTNIPNRR